MILIKTNKYIKSKFYIYIYKNKSPSNFCWFPLGRPFLRVFFNHHRVTVIMTDSTLFLMVFNGGGKEGGICIQHQHLVPPLVHPWTLQVRPFTVALLNKGKMIFFFIQEGVENFFIFFCM